MTSNSLRHFNPSPKTTGTTDRGLGPCLRPGVDPEAGKKRTDHFWWGEKKPGWVGFFPGGILTNPNGREFWNFLKISLNSRFRRDGCVYSNAVFGLVSCSDT